MLVMAVLLIAGSLYMPKVFGAGGGPSCGPSGAPTPYNILVTPNNKGVASLDVSLDGRALQCANPIASYEWDFGDGTTGEGQVVSHQYGPGSFKPVLKVTDTEGLSGSYAYYQDIVVKESNQDPVATNTEVTVFNQSISIDVTSNTSDADGDELKYYLNGADQYGGIQTENGRLSSHYTNNGTFTYHPLNFGSAEDIFTVRVEDGFGGTTTATLTVHLETYVTAVDDNASTHNNSPITINVLANDSSYYGEPIELDSYLYYQIGGRAVLNPDNTITFTPSAGFVGTASFGYTISSSNPDFLGVSQAYVYIDVTAPPYNNPPVANNDSATVDEDGTTNINVLGNDTDVENGNNLSVQLVSQPTNGTATLNADKTFTYQPNANYYGTDQFTYSVTDAGGNTTQATVSIIVNPVNDNPSAGFTYKVNSGGNVSFDASGSTSDIDGQVVSYIWNFGDGTTGSGLNPSHKYKGKTGSYQVTVTVTDNQGATATHTATVIR